VTWAGGESVKKSATDAGLYSGSSVPGVDAAYTLHSFGPDGANNSDFDSCGGDDICVRRTVGELMGQMIAAKITIDPGWTPWDGRIGVWLFT